MINTKEAIEEILTEYGVTFTDALADRLMKEIHCECKAEVLDKIRAEIIENSIEDCEYHGCGTDKLIIETSEVLNILDKYRAESEDKE